MEESQERYMRLACDLANNNIENGGGPFGCIIVNPISNTIVGIGENMVRIQNDPTQHAEIVAIRHAARTLKTYDLSQCILYTSCEPCPMCFGAIYWSRIRRVYYGNTREDAASIGFDDAAIYEEISKPIELRRIVQMTHLLPEVAKEAFDKWRELDVKPAY